jgi:hypothetical protein
MASTKKKNMLSKQRYNDNINQRQQSIDDLSFRVTDNLKAEYDMWSWIYQEIANLRVEVSRLGSLVRMNTPESPTFLEPYHSQIYALLIPVSVVINDTNWRKVETLWLELKRDINEYLKIRNVVHNKKVPFELIQKMDKLYRIALLLIQKAGLGFKVTKDIDINQAIEKAIAGS